jgi:hypothetical protein
MRKLSARHKIKADSYVDGKAWVRAWVTEDELEADPIIQKILATDVDYKQKIKPLMERVQQLLGEKGYADFDIQNVSRGDEEIDHKQLYALIDKHDELNWERTTDKEWQALKQQLQTEPDPAKQQQIKDRMTQLEDESYPGSFRHSSKLDNVKKTAEVCAVCRGEDHEGEECPLEAEPKKKAYPEDKWPKQEQAVPIGMGERGWQAYEPYKQSSPDPLNKSVLRNEDLKKSVDHLMVNKDPKYLAEVKQKLIDFVSQTKIDDNDKKTIVNKVQSIQKPFDLMKYYYYSIAKFEIGSTDSEIKSDFGFFDGPVDLGKDPKGDFPSVMWMPRGQEDLDVSDNITTALKKIYNHFKVKLKLQKKASKDITLAIKPEAQTFWYEDKDGNLILDASDGEALKEPYKVQELTQGAYQNSIMPLVVHSITKENEGEIGRFETTINCIEPIVLHLCNKQGWKLTDAIVATANTCERCLNILLEQVTGEPYLGRDKAGTHCNHCAEIDPDWDKVYMSKQSAEVVWLYKEGQETDILDEHEREIASKWGPEYNTALRYFTDAIKNGHDKDRAFQYAIAEMEKVKTPIQPDMLLEVIDVYSTKK